jgi:hypothetical protein
LRIRKRTASEIPARTPDSDIQHEKACPKTYFQKLCQITAKPLALDAKVERQNARYRSRYYGTSSWRLTFSR